MWRPRLRPRDSRGDRLDVKTRAKILERADEERPGAFRVEPEIRPFRVRRERRVGRGALGKDGAAAVEDDDFDVRLADVEDCNAAAHALFQGRRRRPAPRAWMESSSRRPSGRLSTP